MLADERMRHFFVLAREKGDGKSGLLGLIFFLGGLDAIPLGVR